MILLSAIPNVSHKVYPSLSAGVFKLCQKMGHVHIKYETIPVVSSQEYFDVPNRKERSLVRLWFDDHVTASTG